MEQKVEKLGGVSARGAKGSKPAIFHHFGAATMAAASRAQSSPPRRSFQAIFIQPYPRMAPAKPA